MTVTDAGLGTLWDTQANGQYYLTALVTDFFVPEVQDTRNNACPILGLIPEKSMETGGKYTVIPFITGRNTNAMNFVRERGKMPDPGTTRAGHYSIRSRKLFMRLMADGDIMEATDIDSTRFVDYFEFMTKPASDDLAVEMGRILHNDGSGRLCEVHASQAGVAADEVRFRLNQSWEGVSTCQSSPAQFLYPDNRVSFYSAAGVHRGTRTVVSITSETAGPPSEAVVKFNAAVAGMGLQTGDWVVRGSRDDIGDALGGTTEAINSAFRVEPMGLRGIFSDDGTFDGNGIVAAAGTYGLAYSDDFSSVANTGFQGVAVTGASAPAFNRGLVFGNGGALHTPTEEYLQLVLSAIEQRNNAKVSMILSGYGVHDAYANSLTADKRYSNTTELRGGWTVADFKGKPWYYEDRQCPRNIAYMLALESAGFTQYVETQFKPVMAMGSHWYRLPDDEIYHAAWKMKLNFGVGCRDRTGGVVTDLLEATV